MKEKVLVGYSVHIIHLELHTFSIPLSSKKLCNMILFIRPFEPMTELFCTSNYYLLLLVCFSG